MGADDLEAASAEVAQVIELWRDALAARDEERLLALWDPAFPALRYLPTERPHFLTSWAEISDYVRRMCAGSPVKELMVADLTIDVLGADDAFAFGYVRQVSNARGQERRWQGRLQFSLRRAEDGWRIVRYEDSTDLAEAGSFTCRLQATKRAAVADAIRAGNLPDALSLLDDLALPPHFSSADAMQSDAVRRVL